MAEYLITDTRLTGIADEARRLSGQTGTMTPAQIESALESVTVQTYYYGTSEPSSDLGVDGDLYFVMGG